MNNNLTKVEKVVIILTVIAVFMVFGGIGYAFFTMNDNTGSTAEITNTSGKMTITYADGGSNLLISERITPSNTIIANKTFTLTGLNTTTAGEGLAMEYKVGLKYTSSFSYGQIHYYIKKLSTTNEGITTTFTGEANQTVPGNETYTGYSHGTLKKGNNKYTEMVTGVFPANKDEQTITFNLLMQFPDTGENQDTEKGKSINAEVVVNYEPETIAQMLAKLDKSSNGLEVDDTDDQNLRYVGATPKNYILFNNETWRIIGTFNVYNNDINKTEKLIKIIRNDSLGNYSWDSSASSINSGWGINEWSQADLMYELNCDGSESKYCNAEVGITEGYLSTSGTTTWYSGQNNAKNGSYDYSKNIKSGYINKIANVRWNLGGASYGASAKNTYISERGTTHISNPSDGLNRSSTWDGKIALMYPSDYGYASTDTTCRGHLSSTNCKNNNWLFNSAYQWTLSPNFGYANYVFYVNSSGNVNYGSAHAPFGVRPALFLKSDVVITGGTGESIEKAYTLE